MPPRNSDKNKGVLKELEKTISPVLVVNNSSLKPYVELFEYAPENIYQQPLGCLVGFFEVKEFSDDSAYIVNFLTSVLKKEYYINPKRPVTESLDSALHKVNMALSELAKHGNIEWLGKIHAAICVLEKNSAHFSVAGNAKIFLYRKQNLSEISDGLSSDEPEPHPLKTFVNVSSGRMEKNDRLLITSEDIFHILPTTELKKNFQRLEGEKFVQFLKTALSNQMEMIASMVVEMTEPAPAPKKAKTKFISNESAAPINAFSEKTFVSAKAADNLDAEEFITPEEIAENSEYVDKKTGHIYVQGEINENLEGTNAQVGLYWDMFKEKITQGSYATKNELRKRFYLYKKQLAKKRKLRQAEKEKRMAIEAEEKKLRAEQLEFERIEHEKQLELERIEQAKQAEIERIENLPSGRQVKNLAEKAERQTSSEIQVGLKLNAGESGTQDVRLGTLDMEQTISTSALPSGEPLAMTSITSETEKAIPIKTATKNKRISDIKVAEIKQPTNARKVHEMSFLEKLRLAQMEEQEKEQANHDKSIENISIENELFEPAAVSTNSASEDFKQAAKTTSGFETLKSLAAKKTNAFLRTGRDALQCVSTYAFSKTHTARLQEKIKSAIRLSSSKSSWRTKIGEYKLPGLITPHCSKIGRSYKRLSREQKISSLVALALIFIVPIFIAHYLNQPKPAVEAPQEIIPPTQARLLVSEKNINTNSQIQTIYTNSDIVATLVANDNPVVITKSSVVILQNNQPQEFPLPANFGTPTHAAFMSDLSLVLILSDSNKVISFSPVSTKFTENKIDLSGVSLGSFIGTYLTYMYVLDQKSNQILRFPRAEGGFGDKTSWLKDNTSLANVSDMTIDDNIYAIQNNQALKFFKGQKQSFSLEASKTPVHFDKIFTTPDLQNIYVLDTVNSRVVVYNKDGSIVAQYYNDKLSGGTSLTVSEKNKTAYVSTSEELVSISL